MVHILLVGTAYGYMVKVHGTDIIGGYRVMAKRYTEQAQYDKAMTRQGMKAYLASSVMETLGDGS